MFSIFVEKTPQPLPRGDSAKDTCTHTPIKIIFNHVTNYKLFTGSGAKACALRHLAEAAGPASTRADPNYQRLMKQFTVVNDDVDLSQPTETNGRYGYNLHLVLITQHRHRIDEPRRLLVLNNLTYALGRNAIWQRSGPSVGNAVEWTNGQ
jgi:hypothetical protein